MLSHQTASGWPSGWDAAAPAAPGRTGFLRAAVRCSPDDVGGDDADDSGWTTFAKGVSHGYRALIRASHGTRITTFLASLQSVVGGPIHHHHVARGAVRGRFRRKLHQQQQHKRRHEDSSSRLPTTVRAAGHDRRRPPRIHERPRRAARCARRGSTTASGGSVGAVSIAGKARLIAPVLRPFSSERLHRARARRVSGRECLWASAMDSGRPGPDGPFAEFGMRFQ